MYQYGGMILQNPELVCPQAICRGDFLEQPALRPESSGKEMRRKKTHQCFVLKLYDISFRCESQPTTMWWNLSHCFQ